MQWNKLHSTAFPVAQFSGLIDGKRVGGGVDHTTFVGKKPEDIETGFAMICGQWSLPYQNYLAALCSAQVICTPFECTQLDFWHTSRCGALQSPL